MPNYRFTILLSQDIAQQILIYKGCLADNKEGQSFCKLNVMEWSTECHIYIFYLQDCSFLIYHYILNPGSYLVNEGKPPNITKQKGHFSRKKIPFTLFWVVLEIKTTFSLHFKRSSSGKWTHIFPIIIILMLQTWLLICLQVYNNGHNILRIFQTFNKFSFHHQ